MTPRKKKPNADAMDVDEMDEDVKLAMKSQVERQLLKITSDVDDDGLFDVE